MVRTNIYVEQTDLDQVKAVARHRNVSDAEIIREGIRLAVMANRVWSEPFFSATHPRSIETAGHAYADAVEDTRKDAVAAYEEGAVRS